MEDAGTELIEVSLSVEAASLEADSLGDVAALSLEQVIQTQAENRAWGGDLRRQSTVLVNRRLAREITLEQYTEDRQNGRANAAECERRSALLASELNRRSGVRLGNPLLKSA